MSDNHTVYCEFCGRPIHNIRNVARFLAWARQPGIRVSCRVCPPRLSADRVRYNPATGEPLRWAVSR